MPVGWICLGEGWGYRDGQKRGVPLSPHIYPDSGFDLIGSDVDTIPRPAEDGCLLLVDCFEFRTRDRSFYQLCLGLTMEALHKCRVSFDLPAHLRGKSCVSLCYCPLLFLTIAPALGVCQRGSGS